VPGLFNTVTFGGHHGAILWGAGEAAGFSRWSVSRDEHFHWTLSARVARVDSYRLRQLPLIFQAPRLAKPAGLWCFPVLPKTVELNGENLTARLGPPEGR
jgi:hypothetical protein